MEIPKDLKCGEAVLVSACVLGEATRYDGGDKGAPYLVDALNRVGVRIISACPEMLGGLPVPRPAAAMEVGNGIGAWQGDAKVKTVADDVDVTPAFVAGAQAAVNLAQEHMVRYAFLQERSPSCGVRQTHSLNGLVDGPGVAGAALLSIGVQLIAVDG